MIVCLSGNYLFCSDIDHSHAMICSFLLTYIFIWCTWTSEFDWSITSGGKYHNGYYMTVCLVSFVFIRLVIFMSCFALFLTHLYCHLLCICVWIWLHYFWSHWASYWSIIWLPSFFSLYIDHFHVMFCSLCSPTSLTFDACLLLILIALLRQHVSLVIIDYIFLFLFIYQSHLIFGFVCVYPNQILLLL